MKKTAFQLNTTKNIYVNNMGKKFLLPISVGNISRLSKLGYKIGVELINYGRYFGANV